MKHTSKVSIRFRDIDALGHVNNAVYATYLEQARIDFFEHAIPDGPSWLEVGLILARLEIDFKQPVKLDDDIVIETHCTRVGNTSFTLDYRIQRTTDQSLMAQASSVLVCLDYELGQPISVPNTWRAALEG